jgi:AcrR family transcriptional regulator
LIRSASDLSIWALLRWIKAIDELTGVNVQPYMYICQVRRYLVLMEATPKPQKRTPRGQGELLRERLIDAALAILDDGASPAQVSIRGVTKRAGVSPTAFYLHFEDRKELMRACVERVFSDYRKRTIEAASRGDDPKARLINAGVAYITFAREQPERYGLIFGSNWEDEGVTGASGEPIEVADAAFTDLVQLVAAYTGSEDARSVDLDTLALGIWSGIHGFVTLCQASPGMAAPTAEEYATLLANAWLGPPQGV